MAHKVYIDNVDLETTYGFYLKRSTGELDLLKYKNKAKKNWDDEHGDDIDCSPAYFQSRQITLEFWVKATSISNFQAQVLNFMEFFQASGLRQLRYDNLDRAYMVYAKSGGALTRETDWNNTLMVGKFVLRLEEPYPVSKQYYSHSSSVSITITSDSEITIFWGDGEVSKAVGSSVYRSHSYSSGSYHQIVAAGNIENMTVNGTSNLTAI